MARGAVAKQQQQQQLDVGCPSFAPACTMGRGIPPAAAGSPGSPPPLDFSEDWQAPGMADAAGAGGLAAGTPASAATSDMLQVALAAVRKAEGRVSGRPGPLLPPPGFGPKLARSPSPVLEPCCPAAAATQHERSEDHHDDARRMADQCPSKPHVAAHAPVQQQQRGDHHRPSSAALAAASLRRPHDPRLLAIAKANVAHAGDGGAAACMAARARLPPPGFEPSPRPLIATHGRIGSSSSSNARCSAGTGTATSSLHSPSAARSSWHSSDDGFSFMLPAPATHQPLRRQQQQQQQQERHHQPTPFLMSCSPFTAAGTPRSPSHTSPRPQTGPLAQQEHQRPYSAAGSGGAGRYALPRFSFSESLASTALSWAPEAPLQPGAWASNCSSGGGSSLCMVAVQDIGTPAFLASLESWTLADGLGPAGFEDSSLSSQGVHAEADAHRCAPPSSDVFLEAEDPEQWCTDPPTLSCWL